MSDRALYVDLLRQARARAGHPSGRVIAERSGLSLRTVYRVLNGKTRPTHDVLWALVLAMVDIDDDEDVAGEIMQAYGGYSAMGVEAVIDPAGLIAAAIRDAGEQIAKAIREHG